MPIIDAVVYIFYKLHFFAQQKILKATFYNLTFVSCSSSIKKKI